MSYLTANMKMITECADKLAHLGEKLFNETEMKYRAGNKVRIKSLDWYNENKGMNGLVGLFTPSMKKLCGKVVTLDSAYNGKYTAIEKEAKGYYLDDSMIEGLAEFSEDRLMEIANDAFKKVDEEMGVSDIKTKVLYDGNQWSTEFECPEGYEFHDENGNEIMAKRIVLKEKEHKYPQTYEECCQILGYDSRFEINTCYHSQELSSLYKLLVCQEAYWKLSGIEKPKFGIHSSVFWNHYSDKAMCVVVNNGPIHKLSFPYLEISLEFKDNFEDLIKECKDIL